MGDIVDAVSGGFTELLGGIGGAAESLIGRDWAKRDAAEARQSNERSAERQMAFQERMSSTAYQRATADMQAAGINPMLAIDRGGASTPTGAMGTATPASHTMPNLRFDPTTAAQIDATRASAEQARANTAVQVAAKDRTEAEAAEIRARTPTYGVNIDKMRQDIAESQTRVGKLIQETKTSTASAANLEQQTANLRATLPQIEATTNHLVQLAKLERAQIVRIATENDLTYQQALETIQRVKANLPAAQEALARIKGRLGTAELPQAEARAGVYGAAGGNQGALLEWARAVIKSTAGALFNFGGK